MDFTRDPNDFLSYIATVKRDWTRASSEFLGLVEHWQDLSMNSFAGMTAVAAKERSIEGEVLGKQFSIELSPISLDKAGLAEAVLFLRQIGGSKSELGRFSVRRDGAIFGGDGSILVDPQDNHYSYKIFTTVLQTVVEAPAPVDAK
ncbi:hypothetical protein [Pseudomonas brassicacearum]|uniref:Uncharacterized protein n=1 Tax=Pseudomonas brassicacearum TaxID=930166 RepID=A0A423H0D7_9PSED|nr:hypothetical protein [Pseudomonas brassicacearum]RON05184.1 hypothetical protein BK658_02465 [Pseudomonas brassicacearum]